MFMLLIEFVTIWFILNLIIVTPNIVPCNVTEDCTVRSQNLSCIDSRCQCSDENHILLQNGCKPKVAIDGICTRNDQCTVVTKHSICVSNRCKCRRFYRYNAEKKLCYKNADYITSMICKQNSNCTKLDKNLLCRNFVNRCHCKSGYEFDILSNSCAYIPNVKLNGQCSSSKQCFDTDNRRECHNNVCRCKRNYTVKFHLEKKKCSLQSDFEEPCHYDYDCKTKYMFCYLQRCRCRYSKFKYMKICPTKLSFVFRMLNYPCKTSESCQWADNNAACRDGLCRCKVGYTPYPIKNRFICRRFARPQDNCTKNDFFKHSACINGVTKCIKGFVNVNGICIQENNEERDVLIVVISLLSIAIVIILGFLIWNRIKQKVTNLVV